MCAAREQLVNLPITRLCVHVLVGSPETPSSAAGLLKRETFALPTPVDLELHVNPALIGLEPTSLSVRAQLASEEIPLHDALEASASTTVNVVLTRPASTTIADLLVRTPVDRTLSVRPGTTEPSAPVLQDSLEILSLPADSQEGHRLMLSDFQDSVVMHTPTSFSSQRSKTETKD